MLRRCLLGFGLLLVAVQSLAVANELPLMPYPLKLERKTGALLLADNPTELHLGVELVLADTTQHTATDGQYLIQHLQQRLTAQAGRPVMLQSVNAAEKPRLHIEIGKLLTIPNPGDDESYQLQVTPQLISLTAETSSGALYGLETLSQLLQCAPLTAISAGSAAVPGCHWPAVTIKDQPRFPWRGLLIDSARRFVPLADLKRQLQGMASAKLNVLHWHLTDDQGWRFESKSYPKLTQYAAAGEFYSQAQMRELVSYAAKLGIRVVPEIDLPGHASAIGRAYPHLLAEPGSAHHAERRFGVFAPVLDVSSPQVTAFAAALLKEVAAIFPDPYLHIGGDEVKPEQWLNNPAIQQFMKEQQLTDASELHADFNRRLALQLQKLNRKMIGWDEVLHKDLPKDVLVQSWQGQNAVADSVRAGHPTILSAGYYLDQPMPTSYHYRNDPMGVAQPLAPLPATTERITLDFQLERFNHKPVRGQFILLPVDVLKSAASPNLQQPQLRMRVPQRGELAPRWLQQHTKADGSSHWLFAIDSWLGPAEIMLQRKNDGRWQVSAMLGNTRYPLTVNPAQSAGDDQLLAAAELQQAALTASQQQLILGGEAALWAELVPADILDLKLWPRLYAVAERLWSPAQLRDEDSMYQRLSAMDAYGSRIGLLQQQQQQQRLAAMASNEAEAAALLVLSETVEQSQYYSRHHLKTVRGQYHLDAPLDRLADALPAESLALVAMRQQLTAIGCGADSGHGDTPLTGITTNSAQQISSVLSDLEQQFQRWQQAAVQLQNYQGKQHSRIKQLATQLVDAADIALQWLAVQQQRVRQQTAGDRARTSWDLQQQQLQKIIDEVDEELMALAQPVQQMLKCH